MIIISVGSVYTMREEADALLQQHYQELTLNKEKVKLNVDWDKYQAMETSGSLVSLVARDSGTLVGYAAFFIYQHPHYKDLRVASNDVLFVDVQHRKGTTAGLKLIKQSEEFLRSIGVDKITWHVKKSNDWTPILTRMGYAQEEVIMGKILEA